MSLEGDDKRAFPVHLWLDSLFVICSYKGRWGRPPRGTIESCIIATVCADSPDRSPEGPDRSAADFASKGG